jgi:hypothetical protein
MQGEESVLEANCASGGSAETEELRQLKDLFAAADPSASPSIGHYQRYLVMQEKRALAEQRRREKVEQRQQYVDKVQRRCAEIQARKTTEAAIKAEKAGARAVAARNAEAARAIREMIQEEQVVIEHERSVRLELAREKAQVGHDLDARLDALEALDIEEKRKLAQRERTEQQAIPTAPTSNSLAQSKPTRLRPTPLEATPSHPLLFQARLQRKLMKIETEKGQLAKQAGSESIVMGRQGREQE